MKKTIGFFLLALCLSGCGKRANLITADNIYGNWLITAKNGATIAPADKFIMSFVNTNTYQTKLVRDASVSDNGRINIAGYAIVSTDAGGVTSDVTLTKKDRVQITRSTNGEQLLGRKITDAERDAIFAAGQAD